MNKPVALSTKGLSFSYGKVPTLENINVELSTGKFYGIIGPNGCGKTTFLDLLTGNKKPSAGTVHLFDKPLSSYGKRDLATLLALVPQEYDTGFGFSVEEVVLMGRHPYIPRFSSPTPTDWEHVDRAMEAIGILAMRNRYTSTLSGGQKQRAVVARALAQDTPLLLFDEATSSLDIKYTLQIFNLARDLVDSHHRTIVAVMHNLNLATAYCDEVLIMDKGKIVSAGSTRSTLTTEVVREVFGVDSNIAWDEYNQSYQISFRYGGKNQ
ncbi:ABC transporter ATP-binding protein [Desulforhopalus sp. IMCC35007]|uniref:ABC transporter ATP-binding protein n=1 Tax=Desulforhopalus sp. IMCC35007 TaxID=2569543 RepID=UPI0010AE0B29|nr:ABC transporter ATP-binding protein [Desulforhopalus sp. IMCC35007]TKB07177.1 ABC transporter ATP-binding protein [Desulforhopalus sp. IMCC35007]